MKFNAMQYAIDCAVRRAVRHGWRVFCRPGAADGQLVFLEHSSTEYMVVIQGWLGEDVSISRL
jgi:hypothetical protein